VLHAGFAPDFGGDAVGAGLYRAVHVVDEAVAAEARAAADEMTDPESKRALLHR
jgi:hypothetical protein